jgi:hypothetical protein
MYSKVFLKNSSHKLNLQKEFKKSGVLSIVKII